MMITDYDSDNGVIIALQALPAGVNEIMCHNEDDTYTVLIDPRLCLEDRIRAYHHALNHIRRDDFSKSDVQKIETESRQGLDQ